MRYMKKLTAAIISVSLCVTNLVAFAEVSDKQTIQDYFETKGSDDRETTEIIVSFSGDIKSDNIDSIDSIIQDGLKISSDKEMEIGDISKPVEPITKIDTSLEKVLDENTVLIKTNDVETTLQALKSNENVVYAQPNYRLYTASEDAINNKLWAMENKGQIINGTQGNEKADLNIQAAWDITRGSEDVVVAVLDTGIDTTHPTLAGNIWVNTDEQSNGSDSDGNGYIDDINGWDFVNNDSSVFDKAEIDEHGTHMAGIIAANGQNGVYGVAPNVKIMPLKVMENDSGYTSDIIEAIGYAEANGAKIVNCSFAGLDYNPALEDAISKSDMLFVTAAGNFATSTDNLVAFPACYDCKNIISVGASDNTGSIAALSSYGDLVNVYAPGTGIYSTLPDEQYDFKDGTSCSAAYVSGIAALLYSEYPDLTAKQAKEAICTKPNGDEMQILSNSETQLDAKAILQFDLDRAISSFRDFIPLDSDNSNRQNAYCFSFTEENGIKCKIDMSGEFAGRLTISAAIKSDEDTTVFQSDISDSNTVIAINNIEDNTEYNFVLTINNEVYNGKLMRCLSDDNYYYAEYYNIVKNEDDDPSIMTTDVSMQASKNEGEPNNSMGSALTVNSDDTVIDTLSSASDVDWFKVKFSSNGVANFWLGNVPANCNYQLELYNTSGTNIAGSYNGDGQQELISLYNVSANTWYYVKIYSAKGSSTTSSYTFRTKWYPPKDSYESNDTFASATSLTLNSSKTATINHPDDVDFYKFTISGENYVDVLLSGIPSGCVYDMAVYNGRGDSYLLTTVTGSGTTREYTATLNSGTYYVKIYSRNQSTYGSSKYTIKAYASATRNLTLDTSKSDNFSGTDRTTYLFSVSQNTGVRFVLSGYSSSTMIAMALYKKTTSGWTLIVAGNGKLTASIENGSYRLTLMRASGTANSYSITSTTTTTAKEADITLSNFPTAMNSGDTKAASVTVTNNGMNAWTRADGYKLGGLSDTSSFTNSEFTLTSSDTIQYGQSKTFSVNLTAPSVSAVQDYTLAFRMKQNSSYFNYKSDNKVITVTGNIESISAGNTRAISGVTAKYYKLNVSSTANYVFRTMKYNTSCDTELYLYDSKMNQLAKNDDIYDGDVYSRNYYSKIERTLSAGTYYLCVKKRSGGNVQCYLNVDTYAESNITSSANVSNKYEGYFKYTVSTAGTYVFSTKRYSRNCDTYLILLDANGNVIESNNDSGTLYARIEKYLSKGTYYIRVSSNNYIVKGEDAKTYCTLIVGLQSTAPSASESASISISAPTAGSVIKTYNGNSIKISGSASNCSSVTVKVGSTTLSNVKLNGSKYEAYYTPTESGTYTIKVTGKAIWGSSPSAERTVTIAANDDSDNFNSSPTAINSGTERVAAIDYAGDVDCFSFTPKETGSYKIYSSGSVDLKGILYENDKVTSIGTSYNAPESINFKLAKTLEKNTTYYIRVDAETSGATGKYSINIEKIDEPNDTYFSDQWGLCNKGGFATSDGTYSTKVGYDINVLPVWEYTKGENILVGVIDTGVDYNHDDLKANLKLPGIDTVHNTTDVFPTNEKTLYDENGNELLTTANCGHGTHVAGIIGAIGNNAKGISGVAPKAKILPIKALGNPLIGEEGEQNLSTDDKLLDGIVYAINNKANIVNMSIGGYANRGSIGETIQETINAASNTLFVVSAGNDSRDLGGSDTDYNYPAMYNCDNMIIVAAMDYNGELCDFSNYNGPTQIAAPGEMILSTFPVTKDSYRFDSGTSMAAPHVSGVAALIWSYFNDLTAAQVKQRIISANNVSYNSKLDGKVSSNGYLNAWYAFSNDSLSPRKMPKQENAANEIQRKKELIAEVKSKTPDDEKTTEIFVKVLNGDCISILEECLSSYEYEIVKKYDMTEIYLLKFDSVEYADNAINLLNARQDIKFAEPNYVLKAK